MTRDLTHVYDSRSEAEAAGQRLEAAGVPRHAITIEDRAQHGTGEATGGSDVASYTLPDEANGRGEFTLRAQVADEQIEAAARILEGAPPEADPMAADEGPALGEQTFEFKETAEELVVEKELFIREEVVLTKHVRNHVQEIDDSVRRTEVEVERIAPKESARNIEPMEPPPIAEIKEAAVQAPPPPAPAPPAPSPAPAEPATAADPPRIVFGDFADPAEEKPRLLRPDDRSATPVKSPPLPWGWWAACALLVGFAIIVAYYVGRYLGALNA